MLMTTVTLPVVLVVVEYFGSMLIVATTSIEAIWLPDITRRTAMLKAKSGISLKIRR